MNRGESFGASIPDALIAWTTTLALLAFGVIYLDDAVVMGRTILALGLLSAANQILNLFLTRAGSPERWRRTRLAIALAYVGLVLIGFLSSTP